MSHVINGVLKPTMAMTGRDHYMIRSDHRKHRPIHEVDMEKHSLFSDDELATRIRYEIATVRRAFNDTQKASALIWKVMLLPDLIYLKEIDRLPEDVNIEALMEKFKT